MKNYEVWMDQEYIYVRNSAGVTATKPISRYQRLLDLKNKECAQ
mgnify:FL=1